jgi:hypothetical protein
MTALRGVESRLVTGVVVAARTAIGTPVTDHVPRATMPATADQQVRVEFGNEKRGLTIVGASPASEAVAFNANTVLYPNVAPGVSASVTIAAQDTRTVLETNTIIHQSSAPEVYRFDLKLEQGETLTMTGENTAAILNLDGVTVAGIDATWAVDAEGRDVPLALAVDGAQLVMTVAHRDGQFSYPIVADPQVTWTCGLLGCDVYFSRSVTRNLQVPTNVQIILGVACAFAGPFAPACGVLAGSVALVANKAVECAAKNQCLKFHVPGGVLTLACRGNSDCAD